MNLAFLAASTAASSQQASGGWLALLVQLVPLALIFVVFYFLLIRPQKKREKETQNMRNNIQVGDEIVTIGGIYGRVISLKEDTIVIESASDHSKLTIARWALQTNLTVHDDTVSK